MSDQLDRIESAVQVVREDVAAVSAKADLALRHLTGNGEPERGMILRIDRLEQRSASVVRRGHLWIAALAAAAAGWVASHVQVIP